MYFGPNHRIRIDDTENKAYLEFYNSAAAAWEVVEQFDTANKLFEVISKLTANVEIEKSEPRLILDDKAAGGVERRLASSGGAARVKDSADADVMNLEAHAGRHEKGGADEATALGSITLDNETLALLTADPALAEGKAWYRSDLDRLQYGISDTAKREIPYGTIDVDAHQARHIAGGADELSGLTKAQVAADTIRFSVQIPAIFEVAKTGLAADSTGVKFESQDLVFTAAELACVKGIYLEATWTASATDSITSIELYDVNSAAVLASVSGNTGTSVRSAAGNLTAGNYNRVRVNVTTASATVGATTDCSKAVVILLFGVS